MKKHTSLCSSGIFATMIVALIVNFMMPPTIVQAELLRGKNAERTASPSGQVRYAGPFYNLSSDIGGSVIIDINIGSSTVSGSINFTNDPDVSALCGKGSFSGTRNGNQIQFSFTSSDSDYECTMDDGWVFDVSATISGDELTNGSYSISNGQNGTFSAKRTQSYSGRFTNTSNSLQGDIEIDLAIWSSSVAGYIDFTNDPGGSALCGAGSFAGTKDGNTIDFSFLSNDFDSGCTFDDGWTFNIEGTLSDNNITDGTFNIVDNGQNGTFYANGVTSSISGQVVDQGGGPVSGVTISDGAGHTTTTDDNGNYTLTGLSAGDYTLTPSKSGRDFSPSSRSVSVPPDATGQNFTVVNRYSISGRVTDGRGNPLSDVPVSLVWLGIRTVSTDSSGYYVFGDLSKGFYLLGSASGSPYKLSPRVRITYVPPSSSNQDFTTTPIYGILLGRVTDKDTGKAIANARVSAAGKVGRTDSNGNYNFNNVLPGRHVIRVLANGYKDYKRYVTVVANVLRSPSVSHDAALEPIHADGYRLPWEAGIKSYCSQGNSSGFSHKPGTSSQFAYDFSRNGGEFVVASRDGKVVKVVDRFSGSCYNWNTRSCSQQCGNSTNYVKILHEDGTVSVYLHLRKGSIPVRVGQHVVSGQVIGRVGNTGCSTGEHLHFQRNASPWKWWSVKTSFLDVPTNGIPQPGRWYQSKNYLSAASVMGSLADTEPPMGEVRFQLTGESPHTVQVYAADYDSETVEMRIASSEDGLDSESWQIITDTKEVVWDSFVAYVELKDAAGNSSIYSDTIEVIAFEPITPSFDVQSAVCLGQAIDVENTTEPFCEQCGWNWDLGDGTSRALAEPQSEFIGEYPAFSYSALGGYTMTLTVANADSITSTSHQVTVLPSPSPDFVWTQSGSAITFRAEETDAVNWTWDFGDGITTTGTSVATHTYTDTTTTYTDTPRVYPVQLAVEGSNGCTSVGVEYVEVEYPVGGMVEAGLLQKFSASLRDPFRLTSPKIGLIALCIVLVGYAVMIKKCQVS